MTSKKTKAEKMHKLTMETDWDKVKEYLEDLSADDLCFFSHQLYRNNTLIERQMEKNLRKET